MSDDRVRVGPATDDTRFLGTDHIVWFHEATTATLQEQLLGMQPDRRYAADVDGSDAAAYPGIYATFPMQLSVPGSDGPRSVSCSGLTWVGVHPDHRRQGVLTAMMRHHLEQVRDEPGTHVSALHASEPGIYGRYGYGLASLELEVTLGRGTKLTAPHLDDAAATVTTQLATSTDPGTAERLRACHAAVAELGAVVGDPGYYARMVMHLPEDLRDKEPWRVLFARRDGADVGFAMFRRTHKWENARPGGEMVVLTVQGAPATRLTLLRRLVDFDLMGSVRVKSVDAEDPLLHWAGGPRATSDVATYDSLWVRLVDLPAALADRTWSAPCDVVVEVADRFAPWNEGRWRVRVDAAGAATVQRTTDEADVALAVEALGAAYLGGGNLVAKHRAGLVVEHRAGAVAELWRAMRTDLPPGAALSF